MEGTMLHISMKGVFNDNHRECKVLGDRTANKL
jgi:hypothetical protein